MNKTNEELPQYVKVVSGGYPELIGAVVKVDRYLRYNSFPRKGEVGICYGEFDLVPNSTSRNYLGIDLLIPATEEEYKAFKHI